MKQLFFKKKFFNDKQYFPNIKFKKKLKISTSVL